MSDTKATIRGAVLGLLCSLLGWVGALVILALSLSDYYHYNLLFNPNGVPRTFLWWVAPSVLLLWFIGGVLGCAALVRIRSVRDQFGGRLAAWTAILLAGLPFATCGMMYGVRYIFGLE